MKKLLLALVSTLMFVSPALANNLEDLREELKVIGTDAAKHTARVEEIISNMTDDEIAKVRDSVLADYDYPFGQAVVDVMDALNFAADGANILYESFPQ